MYRESCNA